MDRRWLVEYMACMYEAMGSIPGFQKEQRIHSLGKGAHSEAAVSGPSPSSRGCAGETVDFTHCQHRLLGKASLSGAEADISSQKTGHGGISMGSSTSQSSWRWPVAMPADGGVHWGRVLPIDP